MSAILPEFTTFRPDYSRIILDSPFPLLFSKLFWNNRRIPTKGGPTVQGSNHPTTPVVDVRPYQPRSKQFLIGQAKMGVVI